jgi:hypothetical protein
VVRSIHSISQGSSCQRTIGYRAALLRLFLWERVFESHRCREFFFGGLERRGEEGARADILLLDVRRGWLFDDIEKSWVIWVRLGVVK